MAWSGAMKSVGARVSELVDQRVLAEAQGKAEQFVCTTIPIAQQYSNCH